MDFEDGLNLKDNETDSDDLLTRKNIKNMLKEENDFKIDKEDLYEDPQYFQDYDEIYFQQKLNKNKNNNNNTNNIDLSKKYSKDENLNINSMMNNTNINNNNLKEEEENKSIINNSLKSIQKNEISYHDEDSSISTILKNIKKIGNEIETNSYSYNDSDYSFSKSNISIKKKEEKSDLGININMNENLLAIFEKAYPDLSSINYFKQIYKLIKEKYSELSIFEIMNIIQREVSIKITEDKYNNKKPKEINNINDYDYNNEYNFPIEYLDIVDPIYINNEHLHILKYYKTISINEKDLYFEAKELTEDFLYDKEKNEKRRKIIKFLDNSYNYIPVLCKNNEKCEDKNCIYSHNNYEINYHPLSYKIIYEDNQDYCETNIALCPTAKNLDTDFRIIYNYKDENIIQLMNILNSEFNTHKRIKSYYKKIKKFDTNTFKIFKCKKEKCDIDTHLCYYYHNISEKRRPPFLYRYTNEKCKNIKKNEKCKNGDFCNRCHTSNEFNYHKLHFRKYILCCREIKNGQCIFIDTCYGYHDEKNKETMRKKIIDKKNSEYEKLKKEKNIDDFKCHKCQKITKSITFYYLKCKHILCKKCFNKIKSENICPICERSFKFGDEVMIDFKEAGKNIDELLSK